jgi:hypothetical protein
MKDDLIAIGFTLKEKDIKTTTEAILCNIHAELERIGKYLKVLCEIQLKQSK